MFAPGSRYEQVSEALYEDPNGRQISYKLLRVIPTEFITQQVYTIAERDRLDLIAFRYFGDPLQFWRICDANRTLDPDDLLMVGQRVAIPIAQR